MLKKITLSLLSCLFCIQAISQDTLQTMFYNIYRYPFETPENREELLGRIFDSYLPDLFMVCELQSEEGADKILYNSFRNKGDSFARSTFYPNSSDTTPLQQLLFYNTRKLILLEEKVIPTFVRDINYCQFLLNTKDKDEDSVLLHVFVAHLKSSTGSTNVQARYSMTDTFSKALNDLPQDAFVLFAGDFNFYTSTEAGYQKIIDTTNFIKIKDPINSEGNWSNNPFYAGVHTQATRLYSSEFGSGGASGGLDDRFDFIMASENLLNNNPTLSYINTSYKAFGNNGNCLNQSIKDTACTGEFSLALRIKLYYMSDHTPVIMKLQTNKQFENKKQPVKITEQSKERWGITGSNIVSKEITFNIPEHTKDNLYVFNIYGQLLITEPVSFPVHSVIISHLTPGLYFVRLGNEANVVKFVKK